MATQQHYLINGHEVGLASVDHFGVNIFQQANQLGWHKHEGSLEFVFIREGSVTYEVNDQYLLNLQGGAFSYVPADMLHHALDNQNAPCRMSWIVLSTDIPDSLEANLFTPTEHAEFVRRLDAFGPCTRTFEPEILPTFRNLEILAKAWTQGDNSSLRAAGLRNCLFSLMLHGLERLENPKAKTSNDSVRAAINYMREHLSEPLTMTDIAVYLGLSDSRLYVMFKEGTGLTPNDYLLRLRVSRAKELIAGTDDSLRAIAEETGLGSSQYLCRVFRKYTGHRPSHYRKSTKTVKNCV